MESIREILSNLASQKGESTYKGIAATILTDYDLGIFRTQSELAKKCFVSESVITKFAQSLDFTGWKEFYYSLKSEYKKYYIQPSDNNKSNVLFDQFKLFNNLINNDTDFIEKISESILSKRKVVILPSYQLEDSCEFFYECLLELGIEAYFIKNRSLYPLMFKMDLRDFVVVVALSGQDNCFLVEHYNLLSEEITKINGFVISSSSQEHKLINYSNKLVLNSASIYASFKMRRLFLEFLFISISYIIKTF